MNNGTASISGAYVELQAAVLKALPRNIDDQTALQLANNGDGLTTFLAPLANGLPINNPEPPPLVEAPAPKPTILPMPADFETFEMSMDGNDPANDPLNGMVFGRGFSGNWKHQGPTVKEKQTGTFMWVTVGYQGNLKAANKSAIKVAKEHGVEAEIPEGQWREEVMRRYQNNGVPRGVGDPSWEDPDGDVYFPIVNGDGDASFLWADSARREGWRWLVRASIGSNGSLNSFQQANKPNVWHRMQILNHFVIGSEKSVRTPSSPAACWIRISETPGEF